MSLKRFVSISSTYLPCYKTVIGDTSIRLDL
ncbi:hypothetical protein Celaphus_00014743 [Cervus elaphus hippelaphus]|uniref:Uncharacterized protein n=1 Tax=Cervus elaphus hippelaphus TaxID=46360 RepID=A0A212D3Z5_CEREH|nr:hypothetical protein Celaphus_00014743 [Cervus elaphus hippelaphus]